MGLKKAATRIKDRFFPSPHKLALRKWKTDGGDNALRFKYDLGEDSIVLDLGGYTGQWASDLYARYNCNVYIFEPVRSFAGKIRDRFRHNNKIKVFSYGLGGSSRSETMHISAAGSSVFRKLSKSEDSEEIEIIDAKDWLEKNLANRRNIDLMKINTEGGEYELLERLIESELIDTVNNIQVQFHDVSNDSKLRMERIQAALMKTHEPTYQYYFVWENWKRRR